MKIDSNVSAVKLITKRDLKAIEEGDKCPKKSKQAHHICD